MKVVQVTCPQCGIDDVYFQPEEGDYTAGAVTIVEWVCVHCGYPKTITDWRGCAISLGGKVDG